MKLSDEIIRHLMLWCNSGNDIVVPNWYWGVYECDVIRITSACMSYEYEIKISRQDFFNDFKKKFGTTGKHEQIKAGKRCNRFFFVVPYGLVSKDEVPDYCGLIYYHESPFENGLPSKMWVEKPAKVLHKEPFNTNGMARKLWFRERSVREKLDSVQRKKADTIELEKKVNQLMDENKGLLDKILSMEDSRFASFAKNSKHFKKYFPKEE